MECRFDGWGEGLTWDTSIQLSPLLSMDCSQSKVRTAQTFLSISVFKKVKQRRPASRQAHFSPGPMYVKGRTDVQIAQ